MDSNLNITIRVAGRDAQKQLRMVAKELDQVQRMVGKTPTTAGASSPWSPAIAKRQAAQAAIAAKAAASAQQKILNQAWRAQTAQARIASAQQTKILTQAWNRQQVAHRANQTTLLRQQKTANAQALKQQTAHQAAMAKLGGATPLGFAKNLGASHLVNAGKNINWVGRQLTYNFTLPLALAGAALFKFSMDNEKAMTQLTKLYGNVGDDSRVLKAETDALGKSFELMSSRFGVAQAEVIGVGAAWAAVGAAGVAVAEGTRASIETAILGDIDLAHATEALIAVQQQWSFSTMKNKEGISELTLALAQLNMIENVSGAAMQDLLEVNERAGGVARTAGLSIGQLGALTASLVPATGSAAQAGTALRSIISSLQAPTAASTEILSAMGITVSDPSWLGSTAIEKIELMAQEFNNLSDAQKTVVSSTVATKWQVSRFEIIMRDILDPLGKYQTSMNAIADDTTVLAQRQRELLTVLDSNPKKFDILMNVMKNTLTSAFIPMIPAIMSVVGLISDLAVAFGELSPKVQGFIFVGLGMIAILGPIMSLLGSTMQLLGVFGSAFVGVGKSVWWLIDKALWPLVKILGIISAAFVRTAATALASFVVALGPIGWAIIGALAVITAGIATILKTDLEDQIWDRIVSIAKAFWELPKAIGNAMAEVARVIAGFMVGIIDALSYLNPFARHSPSLVDNVKAGVATILDEYKKLNRIPNLVRAASAALETFSTATSANGRSMRENELQKKANLTSEATPGAAPAANNMVQQILKLEASLPSLQSEINRQTTVVAAWTQALKVADAQVDALQANLDRLEDEYKTVGNAIEAAQQRIADLADTPIQGMQALEDQIFANSHAQNLLNMELLEFERRGISIDSIKDKYAAMAGEIELLRGTQAELRGAGAGSDILGWYDQQIDAIKGQKKEMGEVEKTIADIEKQLDALDLEQRFLELTKAINFDPLERQIDQIANKVTEMPFDEIVRQIREQQSVIDGLQPRYDSLAEAVERESAAVEQAKNSRDGIAAILDVEQTKLDELQEAYSAIEGLVRDMEGALGDAASAAEKLKDEIEEVSRLQELFDAGEGLDWGDQGGTGQLGREGGLAEIEEFNRLMQEELEKAIADMGTFDIMGAMEDAFADLRNLDIFKPFRDAWESFKGWFPSIWQWIKDNWWKGALGFVAIVTAPLALMLAPIYLFFTEIAPKIWGWAYEYIIMPIAGAIDSGWEIIKIAWSLLWDNLLQPVVAFGVKLGSTFVGAVVWAWNLVVAAFRWAWGIIEPIFNWIIDKIDGYVIPIFELFSVIAQIAFKLIVTAAVWLWDNIGPIFGAIVDFIRNHLVTAFEWWWTRGEEVVGFLASRVDWWWQNVLKPVFDAIKWVIDNIVVPAFVWLWNEGERLFGLLGSGLQWTFDNVIAPIFDGFMTIFETVVKPAFQFLKNDVIDPIMNAISASIRGVWNTIAGIIEGGVNFFISAFNLLAKAVNAVAGFLQIDARVSLMDPISLPRLGADSGGPNRGPAGGGGANGVPLFATGGVVPPGGGKFNYPAAIVGEGSRAWSEYVIPTDPKYRANALRLMAEAGSKLLAGGGVVSQFETLPASVGAWQAPPSWNRGVVGGGGGGGSSGSWGPTGGGNWLQRAMSAIANTGKEIVKGAVRALWQPGKALAQLAVDKIPNKTFRSAGSGILNAVDSWVMGRSNEWDALAPGMSKMLGTVGATGPTGSGVTAGGIPISPGSGSWKAFVALLNREGIPYSNLGTYVPKLTRTTGKVSWHALNRAMDFGGSQQQLQRINHALYDAFKPNLHELIWTGPNARNVFNGKDHTFSQAIQNDHRTHVHASMAQGGRFKVPRTPGGVNVNISEGRAGEMFQVLPVDETESGGTTIVINGNLSFPNITTQSDAKGFIENLKALAD